jgi:hypothetical protein
MKLWLWMTVRRTARRPSSRNWHRTSRGSAWSASRKTRARRQPYGQDADLEYDPAEIPEVVAPIFAGRADVVFGSRFLVRRATRVLYYYHYLANRLLTCLSNMLTNRNMTDIETCYKAFRAGVIKPLRLSSRGFGMEVEITAMVCQTNARTYEVPISYYGRTYREGKKIGFRDGVAAVWYIFYYNLVQPLLPSGRRYVRDVNAFLARQQEEQRVKEE